MRGAAACHLLLGPGGRTGDVLTETFEGVASGEKESRDDQGECEECFHVGIHTLGYTPCHLLFGNHYNAEAGASPEETSSS